MAAIRNHPKLRSRSAWRPSKAKQKSEVGDLFLPENKRRRRNVRSCLDGARSLRLVREQMTATTCCASFVVVAVVVYRAGDRGGPPRAGQRSATLTRSLPSYFWCDLRNKRLLFAHRSLRIGRIARTNRCPVNKRTTR